MRLQRAAFGADRRGVAALEFALVLPIMVILFMSSFEVTQLLSADRRVENLSASLADVIARDTKVTPEELADLDDAIPLLMSPNPNTGLRVRVTSLDLSDAGEAKVVWSHTSDPAMTAWAKNADVTSFIPEQLITAGTQSLVWAEVSYDYVSPFGRWTLNDGNGIEVSDALITLSHEDFRRPRIVDPVPYDAS